MVRKYVFKSNTWHTMHIGGAFHNAIEFKKAGLDVTVLFTSTSVFALTDDQRWNAEDIPKDLEEQVKREYVGSLVLGSAAEREYSPGGRIHSLVKSATSL